MSRQAILAIAGDQQALADLFVRCRETMLVRAARAAPERDLADLEDVVSESLMAALVALRSGGWKSESGSFLAWLDAVVRHDLVDAARRQARRPRAMDPDSLDRIAAEDHGGTVAKCAAAEEEERIVVRVRRALSAIHPRYSEVLLLRTVLGLEVDDVAKELGLTRRQVIDAAHEGRKRLFARLERGGADWEVFVRHVEQRLVADTPAAALAFARRGAVPP